MDCGPLVSFWTGCLFQGKAARWQISFSSSIPGWTQWVEIQGFPQYLHKCCGFHKQNWFSLSWSYLAAEKPVSWKTEREQLSCWSTEISSATFVSAWSQEWNTVYNISYCCCSPNNWSSQCKVHAIPLPSSWLLSVQKPLQLEGTPPTCSWTRWPLNPSFSWLMFRHCDSVTEVSYASLQRSIPIHWMTWSVQQEVSICEASVEKIWTGNRWLQFCETRP